MVVVLGSVEYTAIDAVEVPGDWNAGAMGSDLVLDSVLAPTGVESRDDVDVVGGALRLA